MLKMKPQRQVVTGFHPNYKSKVKGGNLPEVIPCLSLEVDWIRCIGNNWIKHGNEAHCDTVCSRGFSHCRGTSIQTIFVAHQNAPITSIHTKVVLSS